MKSVKFNDWSELGLKKDVEKIVKKLDNNEPIFLSICIEIVLAVGVILIDHLYDTEEVPWYIWLITGIIAVLPPLVLVIIAITKYVIRVICVAKGEYNISVYVDTFDNSICYWTMMCSSFYDLINENGSTLTNEEKMFYYQEANYYINKSIYKLQEMTPMADKIFSDDINEISTEHVISIQRLDVILTLLKNVRFELNTSVQNVTGYIDWKNQQNEINKVYDKAISGLLEKLHNTHAYDFEWEN